MQCLPSPTPLLVSRYPDDSIFAPDVRVTSPLRSTASRSTSPRPPHALASRLDPSALVCLAAIELHSNLFLQLVHFWELAADSPARLREATSFQRPAPYSLQVGMQNANTIAPDRPTNS